MMIARVAVLIAFLLNSIASAEVCGSEYCHVNDRKLTLLRGSERQLIVPPCTPTQVEPDDFAVGDDISTSTPGVTLSAGLSDFKVYSKSPIWTPSTSFTALTGDQVFGHDDSDRGGYWGGINSDDTLRADFDPPTNYVKINVGYDDGSDPARGRIYDSLDNLLETFTTAGDTGAGTYEPIEFLRATADISYLVLDSGPESVVYDLLEFCEGLSFTPCEDCRWPSSGTCQHDNLGDDTCFGFYSGMYICPAGSSPCFPKEIPACPCDPNGARPCWNPSTAYGPYGLCFNKKKNGTCPWSAPKDCSVP